MLRVVLLSTSLLLSPGAIATDFKTGNESRETISSGWIMTAPDDQQRFYRIQTYLRGFDHTMWEVGERYEKIKQAVQRNNPELAQYHWKKIRKTILTGLIKRPKRAANAHALFLDQAWPAVNTKLETGKEKQINQALTQANHACIACHIAEGVGFINNQSMFITPSEDSSLAHP